MTAADALTALAQEAAELHPAGALIDINYFDQRWHITIHVQIPEALSHCTTMHSPTWGAIDVTADCLDAAVAEAARRVTAAIADTPATRIP